MSDPFANVTILPVVRLDRSEAAPSQDGSGSVTCSHCRVTVKQALVDLPYRCLSRNCPFNLAREAQEDKSA